MTGQELRDRGMQTAIDHAKSINAGWDVIAEIFLKHYISNHEYFKAEDVVEASHGIVPEPPDVRAWGGIVRRVAGQGYMRRFEVVQANKTSSHMGFVTLWKRTERGEK